MQKRTGYFVNARRGALILAGVAMANAVGAPVMAQGTRTDYERAAKIQNFDALVSRLSLSPDWIGQTSLFWYIDNHEGRKSFVIVDPARNSQAPAFDHARLADGLSRAAGGSFVADNLPFDRFSYAGDGSAILFTVGDAGWRCTLADYACVSAPAPFRKGDALSLPTDAARSSFATTICGYATWSPERNAH